jgi:hypothetical protein
LRKGGGHLEDVVLKKVISFVVYFKIIFFYNFVYPVFKLIIVVFIIARFSAAPSTLFCSYIYNLPIAVNNEFDYSKLPLCVIKHHAMKTYGGVEVKLYAVLTSALDVEKIHLSTFHTSQHKVLNIIVIGKWHNV